MWAFFLVSAAAGIVILKLSSRPVWRMRAAHPAAA
jgi:hypothetical protein